MANRFSVSPPSLQGLGQIATAYGQQRDKDQAEEKKLAQLDQQKAGASQAMQFLNQANASQDPAEKENLFMQAYKVSPEFTGGLMKSMKLRSEAEAKASSGGEMTPYQAERLKIDQKGLELREIESKLRQEANKNKRKSIENKLKKERIKLDELERQVSADQKGGVAQKMLRDAPESAKKASSFARRMTDAGAALDKLEETIDPTNRVIGYISGGTGITSEAANRMASPEEQAYASAASDFVTGQLRQESGAAIGKDEFDRKYREFFPMPGDNKEQIKLKRDRRNAASVDMKNLSGGLYDALYAENAQQLEQQPAANQQGAPEVGFVDNGFKFLGGDPSKQSSWEAQ